MVGFNVAAFSVLAACFASWTGPSQAADVPGPDGFKLSGLSAWEERAKREGRNLCVVTPDDGGGDDAPALLQALNEDCRSKSIILLPGPLYHINSPMVTTDLENVVIEQRGTLLWSDDTDYWMSVSMPVEFQNQSTVWHFGGNRVVWDGHGVGTLDGNGQAWYDMNHGRGNLANRPMNINYRRFTNSVVKGLRFVQSQMWTMNIIHSKNLIFEDIYVNSTSSNGNNTLNTDGADTVDSDNIIFRRWVVSNGDDFIALKGNSSNIYLYDSEFYNGQGIAIGSVGQYEGRYEYIENFFVKNVTLHNVNRACYIKSWTGTRTGYPPNGGGGGRGIAHNIVFEDIKVDHNRQEPLFIHQCESYNGHGGENCDTSTFKIRDVVWRRFSGTTNPGVTRPGFFHCSAAADGCHNITIEDWNVVEAGQDKVLDQWHCENVHDPNGFACEGSQRFEEL